MPTGIGDEDAWWCASLDDTGNGTATLYDLIGSNDGTLTSMVPASDWVADTSESGIRALDFDGTDDEVLADGTSYADATELTLACWIKKSTTGAYGPFFGIGDPGSSSNRLTIQPWDDGKLYATLTTSSHASVSWDTTDWTHVAAVYDGGAASNADRLILYINGTRQAASIAGGTIQTALGSSIESALIGSSASTSTSYGAGRADDWRIFARALDGYEVASLASQRAFEGPPFVSVGKAVESDSVNAVSVLAGQFISVGVASESDTANATSVSNPQSVSVGLAEESNSAIAIVSGTSASLGRAVEADVTRALLVDNPLSVEMGRATETNSTNSVVAGESVEVGRATESNTTNSVTAFYSASVGRGVESSTANAVSLQQDGVVFVGRATEASVTNGVTAVESTGSMIMQFYHQMLAG
jgi:hypothetical protein